MVFAPVVDHILPVAVFRRKTLATAEIMVWTGAAFVPPRFAVVTRATLVSAAILLVATPVLVIAVLPVIAPVMVIAILLVAALVLVVATVIVAITSILAEGNSRRGQRQRHDG